MSARGKRVHSRLIQRIAVALNARARELHAFADLFRDELAQRLNAEARIFQTIASEMNRANEVKG